MPRFGGDPIGRRRTQWPRATKDRCGRPHSAVCAGRLGRMPPRRSAAFGRSPRHRPHRRLKPATTAHRADHEDLPVLHAVLWSVARRFACRSSSRPKPSAPRGVWQPGSRVTSVRSAGSPTHLSRLLKVVSPSARCPHRRAPALRRVKRLRRVLRKARSLFRRRSPSIPFAAIQLAQHRKKLRSRPRLPPGALAPAPPSPRREGSAQGTRPLQADVMRDPFDRRSERTQQALNRLWPSGLIAKRV
ncbi:hypothetical protein BJ958_004260 [Nocardioides kongjuensis]|uniref:Uncharacterized protein n=1 Tax=Nocardioides kongjuensis TaxID=349522 RepID=A0A852RXY7_9ACTN|nr:hypothetical protein [Nocardioides kongjuensis]